MIINSITQKITNKYALIPNEKNNYYVIDISKEEYTELMPIITSIKSAKSDSNKNILKDHFKNTFKFDYDMIDSIGLAHDIDASFVNGIIPYIIVNDKLQTKSYYSTFLKKIGNSELDVYHYDYKSAWNSVLYTLYGESYFGVDSAVNTNFINTPKTIIVLKDGNNTIC